LEDIVKLGSEKWHNNPMRRLFPLDSLLFFNMHKIKLYPQSKFLAEMGFDASDTPFVVSAHHQAAAELGKNIRVIATSLDGEVVEAVDHEAYPNVLGVQFHPEFYMLYDPDYKNRIAPNDAEFSPRSVLENNPPSYEFQRRIWAWFIQKTRAHHRGTE
jgi:putative glutamine amidotransferase